MSIGKYLTNIGVIGAALGAFSTMKQTKQMPSDWRRIIVWAAWALGLLLAIGGAAKQAEDERFEADLKAQQRQAKAEQKQAKATLKAMSKSAR